ncbi:MAG: phosphopantetheine-binding protein [Microbacterium sp.]
MSPSDPYEHARALVAAIVPDDISEVAPEEDLRDYGLDSVRVMGLIAAVRDAGADLVYADVVGGVTLEHLAGALASAAASAPLPASVPASDLKENP